MKQLMNFFENLNEFVYISDMDTYELVYMNKKLREKYSVRSMKEFGTQKCYEVLQESFAPCKMCNNYKLKAGEFTEWQYYNPIIQKHLMLKDSMIEHNGRRYRVEIAIDNSDRRRIDKMLENHQKFELLANEGFRLALQASTPDDSIEILLEFLGRALDGERTYVFERNETGGVDNTYEWVAKGVIPQKENLQNIPPDIYASWYESFREKRNVIIEDLEDIKNEEPALYDILKMQGIHTLAVIPLVKEQQIIGFYGVDNPAGGSLDDALNMLQIVGSFIVSTLKRRNLLKKLEAMSYCDPLTKLGNRHALSEYLANFSQKKTLGAVYCDVSGLKKVNDTEGHEAGDRMLICVSNTLKQVFGESHAFRVGGDEFLLLCERISAEQLRENIESVKKNLDEHGIALAIGIAWMENASMEDVEKISFEAEQQMYMDKAIYYSQKEHDRRK